MRTKGQASLPWTLFTSLLIHRLVLLCIDAHCFILWDLPGDVLAAPESALGLDGVILLSLLSLRPTRPAHHFWARSLGQGATRYTVPYSMTRRTTDCSHDFLASVNAAL